MCASSLLINSYGIRTVVLGERCHASTQSPTLDQTAKSTVNYKASDWSELPLIRVGVSQCKDKIGCARKKFFAGAKEHGAIAVIPSEDL
jgi:hypothetical protein